MNELMPIQIIENKIFVIRGIKVMIDRDLAELYGVKTMVLNQAVKRNIKRFPEDFMFKLSDNELKELITNCDRFMALKHSSSTPYAFTEQGVAMLSSVLNSEKAIAINIQIMRAFIKLRELALVHKDLTQRLDEFEHRFIQYAKDMNVDIEDIYKQLNYLADRTKPTKIGFKVKE